MHIQENSTSVEVGLGLDLQKKKQEKSTSVEVGLGLDLPGLGAVCAVLAGN
jgi:hypothetical protein